MVVEYIRYGQDQYKKKLIRAGLNPDPCVIDRSRYVTDASKPGLTNYSFTSERHCREIASREQFNMLLVQEAQSTFLDTSYGRYLLEHVTTMSHTELCQPLGVYMAYGTYGLIADDVTADTKFNIIQYAHQLLPTWYHGTRCSNLDVFKACWKGLQNICGEVTRGFRLHATLLAKSCALQDMMETKLCKWQDMLLGSYIESSKKTIWPIHYQLPVDVFRLERSLYYGPITGKELVHAIHMLNPAVKEIAFRCGKESAANLTSLHKDIAYGTYDVITFLEWYSGHRVDQNNL